MKIFDQLHHSFIFLKLRQITIKEKKKIFYKKERKRKLQDIFKKADYSLFTLSVRSTHVKVVLEGNSKGCNA